MVLCEGLEPSSPDYKTGILAFEITEQIWQGHLESNQEQWNQNLLCYHYTIPQQFGAVDGDRTRRDLIDSQVSPPGELYGIFGGPYGSRTRLCGVTSRYPNR